MKPARAEYIRGVYDVIEEGDPDISTERLLQMTADGCECDTGDVAEALRLTKDDKNNA